MTPIRSVEEKQAMPVLGKIRLGIRKTAASGAQYPSTVEHFVLTDAPEVAKIYGEDPTELDVMFPADDANHIIPTWLKWFAAGIRDKEGRVIGGKLQCYGDGPVEGSEIDPKTNQPVMVPGTAHFMLKRDPVTRIVPTRACLGEQCPDWLDKNGGHQCKQSMNVFVILPRVSWFGVYQIDTTSWNSIRSFHQQINWIKSLNNGVIRMIPFKIVREEKATNFFDAKSGKEKQGRQFIMMLRPNQTFFEQHGDEMRNRVALAFKASEKYLLPAPQDVLERPMEDNFPVDTKALPAPEQVLDMSTISESPEHTKAFEELARLKGVRNTAKMRLLTAKKFEASEKPSVALAEYLNKSIGEMGKPVETPEPSQTPAPAAAATPPPAQTQAPAPSQQDDGLI